MYSKAFNRLVQVLLLFIGLFLFSSCSLGDNSSKETNSNYYYDKTELNNLLNIKNISNLCSNKNGDVFFYDYEKEQIKAINSKGELINTIKLPIKGEANIDIDKNDNINIHINCPIKNNNVTEIESYLRLYDINGKELSNKKLTSLSLDNENVRSLLVKKIKADSVGNTYILNSNGSIALFGRAAKNIMDLKLGDASDIDLDELDNLIVLSKNHEQNKLVRNINAINNKLIWEIECPQNESPDMIYYNKNTKELYGISNGVVIKYSIKGKKNTKILDCKDISAVGTITSFIVSDEENIFFTVEYNEEIKLIQFKKSNKAILKEDKKEIRISSYYPLDDFSSSRIQYAAKEFEKTHSNISIKLETFDHLFNLNNMNKNYEDKLNAEMLSGNGPDIICGYYPAKEYINKNILVNFDEIIKKDRNFRREDYNQAVVEGSKYNGGLYVMPIMYSCNFYIANNKFLNQLNFRIDENWKWTDFEEVLQKCRTVAYGFPKESKMHYEIKSIIRDDLDYFIDWNNKKANFASKEFIGLLKFAKAITNENYMHPDIKLQYGKYESGELNDSIMFIPHYTGSYWNVDILGRAFKDISILPCPRGMYTNTREYSAYNISMNVESQNKDEAWEFIKYLLSEEIQLYLSENSFAVNKNADLKRMDIFLKQQEGESKEAKKHLTSRELHSIVNIKDSLNKNRIFLSWNELYDILWVEIEAYLTDKGQSAEETAQLIQNKVQLYLNE